MKILNIRKMMANINIKMVITRDKIRSPDMILTAFDRKFREQNDETPPEACRPSITLKKNNVEKVDPKKVEKKRCRKSGFIYFYIPSNTFIYLHIHPNSFIRLHIPPHTSKYWISRQIGPTQNTKMVITRVPGHPPGSIFNQNDPTISPDVFACPNGVNFN